MKKSENVLRVGHGIDALETARNYIRLAEMASNHIEGDDGDAMVTICGLAFEQLMVARILLYEAIGQTPPGSNV